MFFSTRHALHRHVAWFLGALCLTLAWDVLGADLTVMHWIGTPQGFPLRDNWLMEAVLHNDMRKLGLILYALMWAWAAWPEKRSRSSSGLFLVPRQQRVVVVVAVTLSLLAINLLKRASATSCPWSLSEFGGVAAYVSHWKLWLTDGGPGHCFPGGHASSAFAFIGLTLPWLAPPLGERDETSATRAWRWTLVIGGTGVLLGLVQTLRGAHYPSHTLWALMICWGVSLAVWRVAQPWLATSPARS